MDQVKIGSLIFRLRKENHMMQMQLAQRMHISDKAVSKWEWGLGCPELSLLLVMRKPNRSSRFPPPDCECCSLDQPTPPYRRLWGLRSRPHVLTFALQVTS